MDSWQDKLKTSGLKITPQRLLILKVLEAMGEEIHPGAEDIWREVSSHEPNISRATVYRNLRKLVEFGLVNELYFRDGKARFELGQQHHHHFVCIGCGSTEKIEIDGLENLFNKIEKTREVIGHQFEIFGYCKRCQRPGKADEENE